MATVVATVQPANVPPRVQLDLATFTGAATAVVERVVVATGARAFVRTGNPATLTTGGAVMYDYEAPFGSTVNYVVTPSTGAVVTSANVTLSVGRPWLLHPGVPNLSQPLIVSGIGDRTRDVTRGIHTVLGRADPIVITDGVRQSSQFELMVRTTNEAAEAALYDLLADSSPLLLQVAYTGVSRATYYQWVSVGQLGRSDMVQFFGNTDVQWTMACTSVGPPAGLLQAQRTWGDLLAAYPSTWHQVTNKYATWRAALTGP